MRALKIEVEVVCSVRDIYYAPWLLHINVCNSMWWLQRKLQKFWRNCMQQLWWLYIISEFMRQPLFVSITILFLVSYNCTSNQQIFEDIALIFLGTSNARYIKAKFGMKISPRRILKYFGYVILQKLLSNNNKISFLLVWPFFESNLLDTASFIAT